MIAILAPLIPVIIQETVLRVVATHLSQRGLYADLMVAALVQVAQAIAPLTVVFRQHRLATQAAVVPAQLLKAAQDGLARPVKNAVEALAFQHQKSAMDQMMTAMVQ